MINPILILVLLPIFDKIIYPLAAKCNFMKKPLQRMVNISLISYRNVGQLIISSQCVGGILCAASFVISGVLELELQKTYAVIPGETESHLHMMNNIPCLVTLNINQGTTDLTEEIEGLGNKIIQGLTPDTAYTMEMTVGEDCSVAQSSLRTTETLELVAGQVTGVLAGVRGGALQASILSSPEDPKKDSNANGKLRVVFVPGDVGSEVKIDNFTLLGDEKHYQFELEEDILTSNYSSVELGDYM